MATDAEASSTRRLHETPRDAARDEVVRGTAIGRYIVVERIGAGGMGEVHAAYDPELDRRIALKLVRARRQGSRAQLRLLREAQALARLSAPNVVTVFDAGTHEDRVFIAMEYVRGVTLDKWLARHKGDWREALPVMLQAGQGLAAAHQAGLVHRDFKPSNAIVEASGRVRVLDFGLALATGLEAEDPGGGGSADGSGDDAQSSAPSWESRLTETGATVGTPAYMAPEQFSGHRVDERSDQFSFCVVLYQALYGYRPFAGEDQRQIARAVLAGEVRETPTGVRVPRAVRNAVRRGLSVWPANRFASMDELLAVLTRSLRSRRQLAVAGTVAAVALVSAGLAAQATIAGSGDRCAGARDDVAAVWNEERRAAMATAFLATGKAFADDARINAEGHIDHYTRAWAEQYRRVCEATRVSGEQSEELMDLKMACLGDRLRDVAALLEVLEAADVEVVENAGKAAGSLPALARCDDARAVRREMPNPADVDAARVGATRERLSKARAMAMSAKFAEGLREARAARDEALQIDYRPLWAEAHAVVGLLTERAGQHEAARDAYETAVLAAEASGHGRAEAEAMIGQVSVVGNQLGDLEEALAVARRADAVLTRLGDPTDLRAALALYVANANFRGSRYDDALREYERAVAFAGDDRGTVRVRVASLNNTAALLGRQGRHWEAIGVFHEVLEAGVAEYGMMHPIVANAHNNLGISYVRVGDTQTAYAHQVRAIEVWTEIYGPKHLQLGQGFHNLGVIYAEQGRLDDALETYRTAIEIKRGALGDENILLAFSVNNYGDVLMRLGRHSEAITHLQEALKIWEVRDSGIHPNAAYALLSLGEAHLALGRAHEALELAQRALDLRNDMEIDPTETAKTQFTVARALAAMGQELERALALAKQARSNFARSERPSTDDIVTVDAWLADRAP